MSDEPQDWRTTKEMIEQGLCPKCGAEMEPSSCLPGVWYCYKCDYEHYPCGHEEKEVDRP